MLLTTTNAVEGKQITQYLGITTSEVIIGLNVFRDFLAGIRDFFGGRTSSYERALEDARQQALTEMSEKAKKVGADAVIGIDFDYEAIGRKGSMLMINVCGTAVKLSIAS